MINRAMLHDKNLSPQAKGMLCYLLSLPKNWKIYHGQLQSALNCGKKLIQNTMIELIEAGYAMREKVRQVDGQFMPYKYFISEKPKFKKCLPKLLNGGGLTAAVKEPLINKEEQSSSLCESNDSHKKELKEGECARARKKITYRKHVDKPSDIHFGDYVRLTQEEVTKLHHEHSKKVIDDYIEAVNYHCNEREPEGYKDYYLTILQWIKQTKKEVLMDQSNLEIKHILHSGRAIPKRGVISTEFVSTTKMGGLFTKQSPILCPRCNGMEMHIWKDGDDYCCFCANSDCLKLDADASKAIERENKANKHPTETGAKAFRLGSAYLNAILTKWIAKDAEHAAVSKWLKNNSPFLVVIGNPGTGKSYLSAAVLNYLYESNSDVAYTTHRRFIDEIKMGIQSGEKREHEIIWKYAQKRTLIFDDLGSSRGTEWKKK